MVQSYLMWEQLEGLSQASFCHQQQIALLTCVYFTILFSRCFNVLCGRETRASSNLRLHICKTDAKQSKAYQLPIYVNFSLLCWAIVILQWKSNFLLLIDKERQTQVWVLFTYIFFGAKRSMLQNETYYKSSSAYLPFAIKSELCKSTQNKSC